MKLTQMFCRGIGEVQESASNATFLRVTPKTCLTDGGRNRPTRAETEATRTRGDLEHGLPRALGGPDHAAGRPTDTHWPPPCQAWRAGSTAAGKAKD